MLSPRLAEGQQIPLIHEVHSDDGHLLDTMDGEWFAILLYLPWEEYRSFAADCRKDTKRTVQHAAPAQEPARMPWPIVKVTGTMPPVRLMSNAGGSSCPMRRGMRGDPRADKDLWDLSRRTSQRLMVELAGQDEGTIVLGVILSKAEEGVLDEIMALQVQELIPFENLQVLLYIALALSGSGC